LFAAIGCGSGSHAGAPTAGSGSGSASGAGVSAGAPSVGSSDGGASGAGSAPSGSGQSGGSSSAFDPGLLPVGPVDGSVDTKLPSVPALINVVATQNDDSAAITFDPVDGALDYRVYPLPRDEDITIGADGNVIVKNAIYRCAGNRETPSPTIDGGPENSGSAIRTQVDKQTVGGYLRTLDDATLGYVYTQPGAGRVPVYAVGEPDPNADNSTCFFARWGASRTKMYLTSESERAKMLANFGRDDGIAFYVPAAADATTAQIYIDQDEAGTKYQKRYYLSDGPEGNKHPNKKPAFLALAQGGAGTQPLMRVFYANQCGQAHDELAVGRERFNRIYKQGDSLPLWTVLWSGITGPTTLVVEALDRRCPFQGHLSPQSFPSVNGHYGAEEIPHQPFFTLADVQAASPTSEVFINGQAGPAWARGVVPERLPLPRAISRSFVKVQPNPHAKMDFFADFAPDAKAETFTDMPCGSPDGQCFQTWRQQSPTFDQMFISVESGATPGSGLYAAGPVMGELWVTYADNSADTNGKFRLTAKQKATMNDATFLHVTMEADAYSTARRYPQILISDQDVPVQYGIEKGHTLVIQPRGEANAAIDWPIDYEIEICNKRPWDVNNQCPAYDLYHYPNAAGPTHLAPNDELGEHAFADQRTLFDVFASTQRIYVFLNGKPYGCANLPAGKVPQSGPVTVTWGDVVYHSGVDHTFAYHAAHLQIETQRHFDNLGFSSNLPAPTWDESRLPCVAPIVP